MKRRPDNVILFRQRKSAAPRPAKRSAGLFSRLRNSYGFLALAALAVFFAWIYSGSDGRLSPGSGSPPIVGTALIVDGDTLRIGGTRIRLRGIDAPESEQTCSDTNGDEYRCGQRVTTALSNKIGGRTVSCERRDVDRYGRIVAVCRIGDEDLNSWLVSEGHAVAYTRYSFKYVPEEIGARMAERGLWSGRFMNPADWRRAHR